MKRSPVADVRRRSQSFLNQIFLPRHLPSFNISLREDSPHKFLYALDNKIPPLILESLFFPPPSSFLQQDPSQRFVTVTSGEVEVYTCRIGDERHQRKYPGLAESAVDCPGSHTYRNYWQNCCKLQLSPLSPRNLAQMECPPRGPHQSEGCRVSPKKPPGQSSEAMASLCQD